MKPKIWVNAAARQRGFQLQKRGWTMERLRRERPELFADPTSPAAEPVRQARPRPTPAMPYTPLPPAKAIDIDINTVLLELLQMQPADHPLYSNLLQQLHRYGKKAVLVELMQYLNKKARAAI